MSYRNRRKVFGIIFPIFSALLFCVEIPAPTDIGERGSLEINARVVSSSLNKESVEAKTVAESLVVEVSSDGMETVTITRSLDLSRPAFNETITNMPVGKNLRVSIWAIGKNGAVTHIDSTDYHTVTIESEKVTSIVTALIPAAGSIYLQFTGFGTNVKSIYASFTSVDKSFHTETAAPKSTKTFLSLDNIPHLTDGLLSVMVCDTVGDTLLVAFQELVFNARGDNSVELTFREPGGASEVEITLFEHGVTVISHDFSSKNPQSVPSTESGELIITEIMFSASGSSYIELYNTTNEGLFFDTLIAIIDGSVRNFMSVEIAPRDYVVIGSNKNLSYINYTPVSGSVTLTSTGNWITIKRTDGTVINQVICAGTNSITGWPAGLSSSSKRSVELAKDKYNTTDNKLGKNWAAATQSITENPTHYGTPGF